MMMIAFGTDKKIFTEFRNRTDVIAFRAFAPQTFGCFLFLRRTSQDTFLDSFEPALFRFFTRPFFASQVRIEVLFSCH